MSLRGESDSLLRKSKGRNALDGDSDDLNDTRTKLSNEIFGAIFMVLMKSKQVSVSLVFVFVLAIIETFQMLSLVTLPELALSNAFSGIVHKILGIFSFISYYIYSSTTLYWLTFACLGILGLLFIVVVSLQSYLVKSHITFTVTRFLFFLVCHLLFVPIIIQQLAAITCRMGVEHKITDFGYCWEFQNSQNVDSAYLSSHPTVSSSVRGIMIASIPALIMHTVLGFIYSAFMYVDNPTEHTTKHSAVSNSRTATLVKLLQIVAVVSAFVLENFVHRSISALIICISFFCIVVLFMRNLPFYSYTVNIIYSALYTLQFWISCCALVASLIGDRDDHTTSIIAYLLSPIALMMGVFLVDFRKRQITLRDSLELTRPEECELKVRFMLNDITLEMLESNLNNEYMDVKPKHMPYFLRACEWFTYACDRWPNDANLLLNAARFHAIYIRDTFSATRYGNNAKLVQPSLDTLFCIYRLHQLVTHLYEEQHRQLLHIDTNIIRGTEDDMRNQRKHRDLMLNVTLERHISEAIVFATRSNANLKHFWEEASKNKPDVHQMLEYVHTIAKLQEKFTQVNKRVSDIRSSIEASSKMLRSGGERGSTSKEKKKTDVAKANSVHYIPEHDSMEDDDSEENSDTVLKGNIVVTLRPLGHIVRIDKNNPSSLSNTITLNAALTHLSKLSAVESTNDKNSHIEGENGNADFVLKNKQIKLEQTIKSVGGLKTLETGDKRGYTAHDRVFAQDSPFKVEDLDNGMYQMFGFVPEDQFLPKLGSGSSTATTQNTSMPTKASWATINGMATEGVPKYNSAVFFFEPHRSEHIDFLRKYALLALHAAVNDTKDAQNDEVVSAINACAPIEKLISCFNKTVVLCQHADGSVFPVRLSIRPIMHPNSPISLLLTFSQVYVSPRTGMMVCTPTGELVTCHRNTLPLLDPNGSMKSHFKSHTTPPLLAIQLFELSNTSIGDGVTAQMDLRSRRNQFATETGNFRDALHKYLSSRNITDFIPNYHRYRHIIQENGVNIKIPLIPIEGVLAENAKSLNGDILTGNDGKRYMVVRTSDLNLAEYRNFAYEANIRLWSSALVNRSRIDFSMNSIIPPQALARTHLNGGTRFPQVGTSTFNRRMAQLYDTNESTPDNTDSKHYKTESGDVNDDVNDDDDDSTIHGDAPLLDLSPRTKNPFIPLSGIKMNSLGFLYHPSEAVCPQDPDFFHKYRKKEQILKKITQEALTRETDLYANGSDSNAIGPSARWFGTSSSRMNNNSTSRSARNNSGRNTGAHSGRNTGAYSGRNTDANSGHNTGANSGRNTGANSGRNTGANSGRMSARGKTKSLLDLDIDNDQLQSSPPPELVRTATVSKLKNSGFKRNKKYVDLFPDYGDLVYFEVVSLHIPAVDSNSTEERMEQPLFNIDEISILPSSSAYPDIIDQERTQLDSSEDAQDTLIVPLAHLDEHDNESSSNSHDLLPGAINDNYLVRDDGNMSHHSIASSHNSLHNLQHSDSEEDKIMNNLIMMEDTSSIAMSNRLNKQLSNMSHQSNNIGNSHHSSSHHSSHHSSQHASVRSQVMTTNINTALNKAGSTTGTSVSGASDNNTVISEQRLRMDWIVVNERKTFSMGIIERYDRYLRCNAFLFSQYQLFTPQRMLSLSKLDEDEEQITDRNIDALTQRIRSDNRQGKSKLRLYRIFFIFTMLCLLGISIFQFLAYYIQTNDYRDKVSGAAAITTRNFGVSSLAFNGFLIGLQGGGFTPVAEQGIGPFFANTLQRHITAVVSFLRYVQTSIGMGGFDMGGVTVHTSSSTQTTTRLSEALTQLLNHADAVSKRAAPVTIADSSLFFMVSNGLTDFLSQLSSSSQSYASSIQKDISGLQDWGLYMLIASFVALVLIALLFLYPAVSYIRSTRSKLTSIILSLSDNAMQLQSLGASLRLNALNAERDAIIDSVEDLHNFHQKIKGKRNNNRETGNNVSGTVSTLLLLRLSVVILLSIAFYLIIYVVGYLRFKDHLEDSVTSLYYTSELSVLSTKVAAGLTILAATNSNVNLNLPVFSHQFVQDNLNRLEHLTSVVTFGGDSEVVSLVEGIHNDYAVDELRELFFHDACKTVWTNSNAFNTFISINYNACTLFDEYSLGSGIHSATADFIRFSQGVLEKIRTNTASSGANVGLVVDDMAHLETFWRLLATAQIKAVDFHRVFIREEMKRFMNLCISSFAVFASLLVISYFLLYGPVILNIEDDFKALRAVLLFVPSKHLEQSDNYTQWFQQ